MSSVPKPSQISGAYLITGSAGIGKTTIAKALALKGYNTIDADKVFGEWVDLQGNSVEWRSQDTGTEDWMSTHRWIYNPNAVHSMAEKHGNDHVFICGVSRNQDEFYPLFAKIFFLHADTETIINRLTDPTRDHSFGKEPHQQLKIQQQFNDFVQNHKAIGAVFLDASKAPEDIVADILQRVDSK